VVSSAVNAAAEVEEEEEEAQDAEAVGFEESEEVLDLADMRRGLEGSVDATAAAAEAEVEAEGEDDFEAEAEGSGGFAGTGGAVGDIRVDSERSAKNEVRVGREPKDDGICRRALSLPPQKQKK
jgi:hypothetical protein